MAIQDQNGVTRSDGGLQVGNGVSLNSGLQSVTRIQLNDQFSCGNDYAPKVRKPYTITKQRERWTDEEHKKFLEALKLYGRAWRRIEEHVGTKTAVQIRSHAQKFFSKVLRDSSVNSTSSMESIEIPPPRPKRRPMHPYPRKVVELPNKEIYNPEQAMTSNSLKSSDFDQENQSPKSVLSVVGSDTLGSSDSDTPNGSSSPISSISGVHTSSFVLAEPKTQPSEEDGSTPAGLNADSILDEKPPMKYEVFPKESVCTIEDAAEESSGRSVKLFGTTLLVTDTCRQFSTTTEACKLIPSDVSEGRSLQTLHPNFLPTEPFLNVECGQSNMPNEAQGSVYIMQIQSGTSDDAEGPATFVPWWSLPHIRPFMPLHKEKPEGKHLDSNLGVVEHKQVQKEGSWTGSNTSSSVNNGEKENDEKPGIQAKNHFPKNCGKGFVPYKRCIAERENQSSPLTKEDREEQRIRLSL